MSTVLRPFHWFYALQYLGQGTFYPFLALYLTYKGLDGLQMGLLFGLTPIVALTVQPVWGILADALGMRRRLLTAACLLTALVALIIPWATGFAAVMSVFLLLTLVRTPTMAIANAITLETLGARRDYYGQIRGLGSLTFAGASVLVGWLVVDRNIGVLPYLFAAGLFAAAFASRRLPSSRAQIVARWWEAADMARTNKPFLVFTAALVILQATQPLATTFLPLYLKELGGSGWMVGAAWGIAAGLEAPLMALTPRLVHRFGAKNVLIALTAAVPLRWFLYQFITNPLAVLPLQVLHSAAAAAYYAAAITYVDRLVPSRWRATGQSFFGASSEGIGIGGGSLLFGWIIQRFGILSTFSVAAVLATVGWIILVRYVVAPTPDLERPASQPT